MIGYESGLATLIVFAIGVTAGAITVLALSAWSDRADHDRRHVDQLARDHRHLTVIRGDRDGAA